MRTIAIVCIMTCVAAVAGCAKKGTAPAQQPPGDETAIKVPQELTTEEKMTKKFEDFLAEYLPQVKKLDEAEGTAAWNAYTQGTDEAYAKMEEASLAKKKFHSDTARFALLKEVVDSGAVKDPLLARQLTLIFNAHLENQVPAELMEKMVKLSTGIEKTFNTARGTVDGKTYTRNDVIEVLKNSADLKLRKKVWEAHKEVGSQVADRLKELVALRNEAAAKLGYGSYREMQLALQEHDPQMLDAIFAELDEKTRQPFADAKAAMDKELAKRFKIKVKNLRPWHYADPFFQDAPKSAGIDFDAFYKDKDVVAIATSYYTSFGLDPAPILARSDLMPRPGKSEHAFCFTLNRETPDIRVLCNITPTERWMETLMHELGHGFYDSFYDAGKPWVLRQPAHIFTTEGIAQLFGEMTKNPWWLGDVLGVPAQDVAKVKETVLREKALSRLIFARWSLVMYHFEKGLYEDAGQDLVKLWWDTVEKYQMIARPDTRGKPDWATKDHLVTAPVYYHNYVLGQMFQCQLQQKLAAVAGEKDPLAVTFKGKPELGAFLVDKVFKPGADSHWAAFVEQSTGAPLGVDAYISSLGWGKE